MADRGAYRAIKTVLLDGPDFQRLSERARHVFLALKLTFGPTGIEVRYPGALEPEIAAKTGIPLADVTAPLDELEAAGWIRRDANVVWITGQLEHDPHMSWDDAKHRTSIWRHLQGLPRIPIVGEFVRAYRQWFEEGESTDRKGDPKTLDAAPSDLLRWLDEPPPPEAQRRASEGPGEAQGRPFEAPNTDNRVPKTEERISARADAREESPPDPLPPSGFVHPAQRMSAVEVLTAWENAQPIEVPRAEREKQRGFARKIADSHSRDEVMAAFVGIGQLYPHDAKGGQPWDLRDLDRKFSKALSKARDHPKLKERRFDEEFSALTEHTA